VPNYCKPTRPLAAAAKLPQAKDNSLRVRTFNQAMTEAQLLPIPQMLFGKFWFEGELCILFRIVTQANPSLQCKLATTSPTAQACSH